MFKVKITVKLQDVDECLSGQYLLNYRTFTTKRDVVMHQHEPG